MFNFIENSKLSASWIPSCKTEGKLAGSSKKLVGNLKSYDILGLEHLYKNYKRQFKGAILNEEDGFNMHLQVSTFLNCMLTEAEQKFIVLVLCPEQLMVNWHYHLSVHGGLQVQIVTPRTCPEDFDQDHGLVLLLSFTNIKLAGALVEYRFFSVVIDHLDEVANKLVIKKLHGDFNIGLSRMHFYSHPNQKLQWTMLNWSNPGCVGKLDEFYQNDNDNFANLRDNYHHWWFTLTWKFCDSFQKQTDSEIKSYSEILSKWASENNLIIIKKGWTDQKKIIKSVTKTNDHLQHTSKSIPDIDDDAADINVDLGKRPKKDNFDSIHLEESSSDTVIYEQKFLEVKTDESHISKPVEDEIILSLIDGKDQATPVAGDDPKIEVTHKKEELMSEIFDDNFSHTESQWHPEDDDDNFLLSLI